MAGEAVVELEARALEAAAVHRAHDDLVVESAEQQQVVEDVGGGEDAVDAGPVECQAEPFQQVGAVGHGELAVPDAEGAAGRVVGGDDHQAAVVVEQRRRLRRAAASATASGRRVRRRTSSEMSTFT